MVIGKEEPEIPKAFRNIRAYYMHKVKRKRYYANKFIKLLLAPPSPSLSPFFPIHKVGWFFCMDYIYDLLQTWKLFSLSFINIILRFITCLTALCTLRLYTLYINKKVMAHRAQLRIC